MNYRLHDASHLAPKLAAMEDHIIIIIIVTIIGFPKKNIQSTLT